MGLSNHRAFEVMENKALKPEMKEKGLKLFSKPEMAIACFVMNSRHALFKNHLQLRQAMAMAFDGEGYNALFYKGTAVLAQSIVPPGLPGYRADYVNPYQVYDLEKAKKYLAAAGYPEGKGLPEITLDLYQGPDSKNQGDFFRKCMEKIGIRVKVIENAWPELLKKIKNQSTMLHAMGWIAAYPDAETFLQNFYGPNQPGGLGANFHLPAYDELYKKAVAMQNSITKSTLYERLNKMVGDNVPAIWLVHPSHLSLSQGWVKNYLWADVQYGDTQYVNIDLQKKEALLPQFSGN